jgi:adenylate cyclase
MRRWLKGLASGLSAAAAGAVLLLTPPGVEFERGVGLAGLFKLRGPIAPPADVVVVAIDDQTGERLGLSKLPREWRRSIHAQLVSSLTRRGASAVVFDFDFQLPKKAEDDAAFAAAIAESGRVVLAEKLVGKRQPILAPDGKPGGSVWIEQLLPPTAPLAEAAKGLGPFPLPKVDVAVHEFWTFKPSVGDAPTMPAVALQLHAMLGYRHLLALAQSAAPSGEPLLPPPPGEQARAAEVRDFMRAVRAGFVNHPDLGNRILKLLDGETGSNLSPADRRSIAALVDLYSGGEHRLLNFYGPAGTIPTVPYHLVALDGARDNESGLPDLHGKVAFVGFSDPYDPGQPDRFYTVFTNSDGVDLSGVEIAATGFANLLTNHSVRAVDLPTELAMVAVFGVAVGMLVYLLPAIAGVPLVLAASAAYAIAAYHTFSRADLWLPLATPLLVQLPLALFVGLIAQYLSERDKKRRATSAISLYLPEHLARDFTEKALDPSALNRVTHSVCFASDMAGFTTIAEKLRPKELAAFLNDYFESLSGPLKRHKVDVIEFRADGIMCAWTTEQPDAAVRRSALQAAVEAVETIARFKERHSLLSQSLRIGLETGMVYVGHAGGGGHFVYSIVGDCANTAARIEGLNKHLGTQVLASGTAIEGVEGLLTRFLGEFIFVGKTEALPIYEIMGRAEIAAASERRLCERFAQAMEVLREGRWRDAGDLFEEILRDFPDDGPARFHLARCRKHADAPPEHPPWQVRMDSK